MDFKLFLGVVNRYKRIVIVGAVLAVVLSVLSYGTPGLKGGKPTIVPRGAEVWQGNAELLISQAGFPYGRAVAQVTPGKGTAVPSQTIGDYNYMASLSSVYAAVANGNAVQRQVAAEAGVPLCSLIVHAPPSCGSIVAAEVADLNTGAPLPLLTLTSSAPTAAEAAKLATTSTSVLRNAISQQQVAASTPVDQRVELQTVKTGTPATLSKGHSKSIPILVLFAVMSASIALAFIRNSHSDDPVRSTRRRLDDGLGLDAGPAFAGAGNGHVPQPDLGLVHAGDDKMDLHGLRMTESAMRLPDEENAAGWRAADDESSPSNRRQVGSDRPRYFLRTSRIESESRD